MCEEDRLLWDALHTFTPFGQVPHFPIKSSEIDRVGGIWLDMNQTNQLIEELR